MSCALAWLQASMHLQEGLQVVLLQELSFPEPVSCILQGPLRVHAQVQHHCSRVSPLHHMHHIVKALHNSSDHHARPCADEAQEQV